MIKNKKAFEKLLKEKTISLDEIIAGFTPEQRCMMEAELRKYDMLLTLRRLREKLDLTQEKLAEVAHVPRTTITKIESGNYNPTIHTLDKIARALGKRLEVRFV